MDKHEEIALLQNAIAAMTEMREMVLELKSANEARLAEINAILDSLGK